MTNLAVCNSPRDWHNCYSGNYDLWCSEAYIHPAKMAPALGFRILEHLEELGLLEKESVVLDFMAGISTVGLCWGSKGGKSIMVELEPKFVALSEQNKAHLSKLLGHPIEMQIIQGDSRHLGELLQERGLVSVVSPPFGEQPQLNRTEYGILAHPQSCTCNFCWKNRDNKGRLQGFRREIGDGTTPGQIGNLKDVPLVSITSPPYEDMDLNAKGAADRKYEIVSELAKQGKPLSSRSKSWLQSYKQKKQKGLYQTEGDNDYGQAEGQIGQERSQSYLDAMKLCYSEAAKVADVLVVVTKNPTRNGKLRRLDLDTAALLQATGWLSVCQHRAILFEEQEQGHLFEGSRKKVKGRMSFFRRLAWQKGSPTAQWEDVLICVRDDAGKMVNRQIVG